MRVQAVFAQARQIHHEGVFELAIHRLLDVVEVLVFRQLVELTAGVIFPVRPFSIFAIRSPVISERGRAIGCDLLPSGAVCRF